MVWAARLQCWWPVHGGAILQSVEGNWEILSTMKGSSRADQAWVGTKIHRRDKWNEGRHPAERACVLGSWWLHSKNQESGNKYLKFLSLSPGLLGALPMDLNSAEGRRPVCPFMKPLVGRKQGKEWREGSRGATAEVRNITNSGSFFLLEWTLPTFWQPLVRLGSGFRWGEPWEKNLCC